MSRMSTSGSRELWPRCARLPPRFLCAFSGFNGCTAVEEPRKCFKCSLRAPQLFEAATLADIHIELQKPVEPDSAHRILERFAETSVRNNPIGGVVPHLFTNTVLDHVKDTEVI